MATVVLIMEVRRIRTLTALLLPLTSLSPCLIFIIKILFLISMDFLPRAAMAMTPLTRSYNVLNIQIKIFSLSSFLQHAKLFLQSTTKPTPPTPSVSLSSIVARPSTNTTSYADALNAPNHPPSLSLSLCRPRNHTHTHQTSHCSCPFAITK